MLILGLSQAHDASVALVDNGRLVGAIGNERISRIKKQCHVTPEMVEYVLQMAGKQLTDIDYIAVASCHPQPNNYVQMWDKKSGNKIPHLYLPPDGKDHEEYFITLGKGHESKILKKHGMFMQHQLAHCASAYYTSPFKQAACFSVDSSLTSPEACSMFAYGDGDILHSFYCPGVMIGNAYYYFTDLLGLGNGLYKAGTTMGLAAYGNAKEIAKKNCEQYGQSWYARQFQEHGYPVAAGG